ncbi:hypothetical protein HAX54_005017, partial [Datura stramonium]|nr:hypothetical protein [Datura stramonium]
GPSRVVAQLARGRSDSHTGQGSGQDGVRVGGRRVAQIEGVNAQCYAFPGCLEAEVSDAVIT